MNDADTPILNPGNVVLDWGGRGPKYAIAFEGKSTQITAPIARKQNSCHILLYSQHIGPYYALAAPPQHDQPQTILQHQPQPGPRYEPTGAHDCHCKR